MNEVSSAVPTLLSIAELSARIGATVSTIYRWTCERRIPTVKVGTRVMFEPAAIDAWLAARRRRVLTPRERRRLEQRQRTHREPPKE